MKQSTTNYTGTLAATAFAVALFLLLGSSTHAEAATIYGRASATIGSWFFDNKMDYWASRWKADADAKAALYRRAKAVCPGGYTIVSGPTLVSLSTTHAWSGAWGAYTSTCAYTMEIECDSSKKSTTTPPHTVPKTHGKTTPSKKEVAKMVEDQTKKLANVKTAEDLLRMVQSHKIEDVDYTPFEQAMRAGEVKRLAVPSKDELLQLLNEYIEAGAPEIR